MLSRHAIGIPRMPSWLWLARRRRAKLQSTFIKSRNGRRRRDSSSSKMRSNAKGKSLCKGLIGTVNIRRRMSEEAKRTQANSWIRFSISLWVARNRYPKRCLSGPTKWRVGMRTMLKGLIEKETTWILTVIRTSRLSYTIRNAAQGKSCSARSTSL